MRRALRAFGASLADNPGRLERVRVGDVTALVDYAHNPAGLTALLDAGRALPAARRLLVLGLLVLPLHERRAALVTWLRALDAAGWRAGAPVPDPPAEPIARLTASV